MHSEQDASVKSLRIDEWGLVKDKKKKEHLEVIGTRSLPADVVIEHGTDHKFQILEHLDSETPDGDKKFKLYPVNGEGVELGCIEYSFFIPHEGVPEYQPPQLEEDDGIVVSE